MLLHLQHHHVLDNILLTRRQLFANQLARNYFNTLLDWTGWESAFCQTFQRINLYQETTVYHNERKVEPTPIIEDFQDAQDHNTTPAVLLEEISKLIKVCPDCQKARTKICSVHRAIIKAV